MSGIVSPRFQLRKAIMDLLWYHLVAVVLVGFVAGFINTLAGSGSLLTLPLLMFIGLPAGVANGTNRIAILLQTAAASASFRQQGQLDVGASGWLALPAALGALLGAALAWSFDEVVMQRVIAGLLVAMIILIAARPRRWLEGRGTPAGLPRWLQAGLFCGVGVYGGFIQAGVGFFLLAALVLGHGVDLVRANALKVFIILLYTPVALVVFVLHGQVHWGAGLTLALGNVLGALVATRVAVSWGPRFVRWVLLIALLVAAVKLIGLVDLVISSSFPLLTDSVNPLLYSS